MDNNNTNNNKPNNKVNMPKFNLNWLYMIIALMLLGLWWSSDSRGSGSKVVPYSDFQKYVTNGYISKVLGSEKTLEAHVKPNAVGAIFGADSTKVGRNPIITSNPPSKDRLDKFLQDEKAAGHFDGIADYPADSDIFPAILINILPLVLLIALWIFFMRRMSGGGGGGGGTWTGEKIQISATPAPNAMGNFDVNGNNDGTNGTVGTNTGTTIEELLPQPDPTYFTQGMDNVAGFTDIGSVKWAHKAIATLRSVNVINGKETTKFCPDDSITRAEFVQILIGMLSYAERIDTSDAECSFTDVENDAWYYNSVAAAVKYGIVSGISESEFAPNVLISRQDMCVMIDRACTAANITLPNGASIIFNDESNISGYALNAVRDMSKAGIVSGFEDGNFKPLENATRAQAAVIIYRMAGGAE